MSSNTTPFLPPPAPPCPYISIRIIDLHVHISSQMEGSCIENGPSEQSIRPYRVLMTEKTIHCNTITEKKNKIVHGLGRKRKRESNNKKEKKKNPQGLRLRCEQREQKKRERERRHELAHKKRAPSLLSPLCIHLTIQFFLSLSLSLSLSISLSLLSTFFSLSFLYSLMNPCVLFCSIDILLLWILK